MIEAQTTRMKFCRSEGAMVCSARRALADNCQAESGIPSRSEPRSSILSSSRQYGKIADKIESCRVWRTVKPAELALTADYRWWGQFNQFNTQAKIAKLCFGTWISWFSLSLLKLCYDERSRPNHFHSLWQLFLCFFRDRLCFRILPSFTLTINMEVLICLAVTQRQLLPVAQDSY